MASAKADFVRIRPWDLATEALVHSATHIKALLVVATLPELVRVAMFVGYDAILRMAGFAWWVPPSWSLGILSNVISAVVFTGIIRYVACAQGPFWLPDRSLLRHYLLTAAALVTLWIVVAVVANGVFNWVYLGYFLPNPFDEAQGFWLGKAYDWNYFVISALLIAAFYPSLGMAAVHGEFGLQRLPRWWRKYFLRFLVIAVILMSVCLLLQRVYWWLLNEILSGLTNEVAYMGRETLRSLVMQMFQVPMDILFDIVPAVAIGLLFKALRANSADL